ncbi:MAG: hypothetical protein ACO4CS_19905 [bacterium]
MIELLTAALIIGQVEIAPGIIRTEYLNEYHQVIVEEEDRD